MTLDEIALKHGTDKASSHHDYCRIYERYFEPLRDQPVNVLEIGVQFGLSIKTWAEYFHRGEIYGVDLTHDFKTDNPHIHLYLGDQSQEGFWHGFARGTQFDIVVDDGCHQAWPQEVSFLALWGRLKAGGFYVVEDIFTWFDTDFNDLGAGEGLVGASLGALNLGGKQYHGKPHPVANPDFGPFGKTIEFIHFYYGLMILKKTLA